MDDNPIEITESIEGGKCKITVKGRVDSNSAETLLESLEKAINEGQNAIILNMSRVDYLSSIGIRVILKIFKQVSENGGKFNIERPSSIVKNVLGIVALEEMLVTSG